MGEGDTLWTVHKGQWGSKSLCEAIRPGQKDASLPPNPCICLQKESSATLVNSLPDSLTKDVIADTKNKKEKYKPTEIYMEQVIMH